jgi:hypothetical protein
MASKYCASLNSARRQLSRYTNAIYDEVEGVVERVSRRKIRLLHWIHKLLAHQPLLRKFHI